MYKKLLLFIFLLGGSVNIGAFEEFNFLFNPLEVYKIMDDDKIIAYRQGDITAGYFKKHGSYSASKLVAHLSESGSVIYDKEILTNAEEIFRDLALQYAKQNPSAPAA